MPAPRTSFRAGFVAALLATSLAGCAYTGSSENPAYLSLTWYSYVDAGDIREACAPGAPERYRIVYNGNYDEQIRAYDIAGIGPQGATMAVRLRGLSGDVVNFRLADPLRSWRGDQSQVALTAAAVGELRQALEASGAFAPPPVGLELKSDGFYWVAAACRDGRFSFHAWQWPSAGYGQLRFPALLAKLDRTGVALNPPRDTTPEYPLGRDVGDRPNTFQLRVGLEGIANLLTLK